jgi:hypothetical protein
MAIMKQKDIDWKVYLRQLAESPSKLSEIERIEFAGYLLQRDLDSNKNIILDSDIFNLIAKYLIAESPDTSFDLLQNIKSAALDFYDHEINQLLSEEIEILQKEKVASNPKDERPEFDCYIVEGI